MAELASGAVRKLLELISKEAQLLAGVRGDVQFIRDEMESMSGLLRHLSRSKERAGDHQVRAWMKQVMELAYDCDKSVQQYARSRARPGDTRLRRALRLPWGLFVRRRVAVRLRKLKARARDIGERQQRYGVAVPPSRAGEDDDQTLAGGRGGALRWLARASPSAPRRASVFGGPDMLTEGREELIRLLKMKPRDGQQWPRPRVIAVVSPEDTDTLLTQAFDHCSDQKLFELQARITIRQPALIDDVLLEMFRKLLPQDQIQSIDSLPDSAKGRKLLLVLSGLGYREEWEKIKEALDKFECGAGSVAVLVTAASTVAEECSPPEPADRSIMTYSVVDFHLKKALLVAPAVCTYRSAAGEQRGFVQGILSRCNADVYCMNIFLHALSSNPSRTERELKSMYDDLGGHPSSRIKVQQHMITFCYDGLPEAYKNCLWYSTVFTKGSYQVRKATLLRRWVTEGLIAQEGNLSAERCFDTLFDQKLILPRAFGGEGKVKTCAVNVLLTDMVNKNIKDEDFLDTNQLPPDLSIHSSIRNGIQLRRRPDVDEDLQMEFLNSLPASSMLRILRVLDLQGCKGFKKRHLRNICKICELRYLSLRGTEATQLPKEIQRLKLLETLDIRQTKIQRLEVVLPKLKHLLAGHVDFPSKDTVKSDQSFSTIYMPRGVTLMEGLEILSHVRVSDCAKELTNLGDKLKKLRKLGVVLCGEKANLKSLFVEIDKLYGTLRSLSIRMETPGSYDMVEAILLTPPTLLESLSICGIRSGLPRRLRELRRLAKITLRDTFLNGDALTVLGVLGGLRFLRLHCHAFAEGALTFEEGQFSCLMELQIEDDILTSITFAAGTAPKLGKIVWSFTRMESLSGIKNLASLKGLEINQGGRASNGREQLQQDVDSHSNRVTFKYNSPENGQGSEQPGAAR